MSMDIKIAMPEQSALMTPAQSALASIEALTVDSPVMYSEAGDELRRIATKIGQLDQQRSDIVKPLNDTVKRINDLFRAPLDMLRQGQSILKAKMVEYSTEQERIAAEARRVAEAAARAERERLAAEAAAAQAQADAEARALREQAEAAKVAGNVAEAAALESRAESRLDAGHEDAVALELASHSIAAVPAIEPEKVAAAGTAIRGTWKGKVVDKAAFVSFVAANPDFIGLLTVDQSALNMLAKSTKGEKSVPGVQFYQERTIAARKVA
jgi:uncharacterized membrane protein YqiK